LLVIPAAFNSGAGQAGIQFLLGLAETDLAKLPAQCGNERPHLLDIAEHFAGCHA
jgi:hypothetical protein